MHKNMENKTYDIILISGEYVDDHPLSPGGIISRVLEAKGYTVAIIEKPEKKENYEKFGRPNLFFAVTSGSIDSMLNNYTPLKKKREDDEWSKNTKMPDRAVIVYCNKIREYFKDTKNPVKIVIGGIESSLRRFAHYDYWENRIRKSILFESRADILVFGSGEKQVLEIAKKLKTNELISGILGTCIISKEIPENFEELPAFKNVSGEDNESKIEFCKMQKQFSINKNLAQRYDNNFLLQYRFPKYTTEDLDWIYGLPFTRKMHPKSLLTMARFSVVTHRGCIGNCSFCSITEHQGDKIVSRSEKSILDEIKRITQLPGFKGTIDDLGGPSANMYGMDCIRCAKKCLECNKIETSHSALLKLMRKARNISGIKSIYVRSGVRFDLAVNSKEYIEELSEHHISGTLKIAPEHFDESVLKLMNKNYPGLDEFRSLFYAINKKSKSHQGLKYYFMIGHPGDTLTKIEDLKKKMDKLENIESVQLFTPTPMTVSTCMYWTGLNPYTLEKVEVVYDYKTKKEMKRKILELIDSKKGTRRKVQ